MKPFNKLALFAGVAELADAQDLGSCGRKAVQVQLLSPAPMFPARKSKLEGGTETSLPSGMFAPG